LTLSATFKEMLKVAFLPAAVELIGHFHLSNIVGKESTERVSCLTALNGIQIRSNQIDVFAFCICHVLTISRESDGNMIPGESQRSRMQMQYGLTGKQSALQVADWHIVHSKLFLDSNGRGHSCCLSNDHVLWLHA
jgi:hypothetical protein